jgi:sugar lactone lactonase YvrE
VARDQAGNLYIADAGLECDGPGGNTVRKIDARGTITTLAGSADGVLGFGGDGGPATRAHLNTPGGVAVDQHGNLYISDSDNFRIRRVDREGIITTVAGTGQQGFVGDGGPATEATLTDPEGLAFDDAGNLYVADFAAVRRIDTSGRITTVAGTGRWLTPRDEYHLPDGPRRPFRGEGGRATDAMLTAVDVALDDRGRLYVADSAGRRVYRVDRDGTIHTVAGTVSGTGRRLGDGGPATQAFIDLLAAVEVDHRGNLLLSDHHGERIRKVDPSGTITTIAGTGGLAGFSGDHGQATELKLHDPIRSTVGEPGILYFADIFNARIRAVRYARH